MGPGQQGRRAPVAAPGSCKPPRGGRRAPSRTPFAIVQRRPAIYSGAPLRGWIFDATSSPAC